MGGEWRDRRSPGEYRVLVALSPSAETPARDHGAAKPQGGEGVSYYTGDPGFFRIAKEIGGAFAGLIPGFGRPLSLAITRIPLPIKRTAGTILRTPGTAIIQHPVLTAAGAAGAVAPGAAEVGRAGMLGRPGGPHPPTRHPRRPAHG